MKRDDARGKEKTNTHTPKKNSDKATTTQRTPKSDKQDRLAQKQKVGGGVHKINNHPPPSQKNKEIRKKRKKPKTKQTHFSLPARHLSGDGEGVPGIRMEAPKCV